MKMKMLASAVLAATLSTSAFAFGGKNISLTQIGTFQTVDADEKGIFDDGAAEIVAFDPVTQLVFVINAAASTVDALSIAIPSNPTPAFSIDVSEELSLSGGVNSVSVKNGKVAIAIENDDKQANGWIAVYDTSGTFIKSYPAGALPDMVTFTPDGRYILAANEGEPSDDYTNDPEGSVTVVDLWRDKVRTADFKRFNKNPPAGVRFTGGPNPDTTLAQDLEPEFIAVAPNGHTAWVALQENNAVAVVDIRRAKVSKLIGLGTKDHSKERNALDASNRDDGINILPWPVNGMYMPDTIASYSSFGRTFYVTANEGDAREYIFETEEANCPPEGFDPTFYEFDDGECIYIDEARIKDLSLDQMAFPDADFLQDNENLGRLKAVATEGRNESGEYEQLFSYGARSFSIWNRFGQLVFDSGKDFEQITADILPEGAFNSTNDENDSFDDRSDDKGPEPEGVAIGKVGKRTYAFVGLERVGGIMVYDVTFPRFSKFVTYVNNRDFDPSLDVEDEIVAGMTSEISAPKA
jgi:DNA-binding beta-propeller fold protein YncE